MDALSRLSRVEWTTTKNLWAPTWAQSLVARLPTFNEAVNTIDIGITQALHSRDAVSLRIWAYKKKNNKPILDPEREGIVRVDMFEYLKVKAHAVGNVWKANNQSDNLWNAIMTYSRSIQESGEPSESMTDTIESLRTEIDLLNRRIVELVAERMKLFARQPQIEWHWIAPIHSKWTSDTYSPIFTELDWLCMAGRWATLPVWDGCWSSD